MDTEHSDHATGAAPLRGVDSTGRVLAEGGQLERYVTSPESGGDRRPCSVAKLSSTARRALPRVSDKVPLVVVNELGNKLPVSAEEAALVFRLMGSDLLKLFEVMA